jgi:hypothetical protein
VPTDANNPEFDLLKRWISYYGMRKLHDQLK